jgi:hypothetical protein
MRSKTLALGKELAGMEAKELAEKTGMTLEQAGLVVKKLNKEATDDVAESEI